MAHRGSPRERVENTLPGFLVALDHGADAIELDVHETIDHEVVVHHDDTIRGNRIADTTWHALSQIDLGGGASIPRLADVFKAIGDRATTYVELKGVRIEESVIATARKHGSRFALHSFDHEAIARVAERDPEIARGILLDRGTPDPAGALRLAVERIRPRDVWPHWSLVDGPFMRTARELGVRIIAWTVNSRATARTLSSLGVDGLCTDDILLLANL